MTGGCIECGQVFCGLVYDKEEISLPIPSQRCCISPIHAQIHVRFRVGCTGGKQEGTCNGLGFDKRSCRGRSMYSDAACLNEVANFSVIVVLGSEGSTMVLMCKGAGLVSRVVTKYVRFPRFASQYLQRYARMYFCKCLVSTPAAFKSSSRPRLWRCDTS